MEDAARSGRELRGWEVDRAAAAVLEQAGYGDRILHRTGHSLGESVHGNGVHLDDYETHDDRRLLPGTGFTIEPGLYFETFGVRTEINVFRGEHEATVTGPRQTEIVTLVIDESTNLRIRRVSIRKSVGPKFVDASTVLEALMSNRKTTLFLRAAHRGRVAGGRHGASRRGSDLSPESSAQTVAAPPMNSAPITRRR